MIDAINWNAVKAPDKKFWDQNVAQFWVDAEIPLSSDKLCWKQLTLNKKEVFKKVLAGLTRLDTFQGSVGMPIISLKTEDSFTKSILSVMGMMEFMHAKSYSSIFMTLCSSREIVELFNWVDSDLFMNKKLEIISHYYSNIKDRESLYLAMVCSVLLESFLFYSGFFYPLYLAGKGQMVNSGEIINLIIRDESIHGVFMGGKAKELFKTFSESIKKDLLVKVLEIFNQLYSIEIEYTNSIYSEIGLTKEVTNFITYNANRAFVICGLNRPFPDFDNSLVNPVVFMGIDTRTKLHDFFSVKGNGYVKALIVEELSDDDFM